MIAVFVDYKDAFSSTSHVFLDEALGESGISNKIRRLIRLILSAAKCAVTMRGADGVSEHSPHFNIGRGVLQGDIFSPVCFIVGLQKLFKDCNEVSGGKFSAGAKVCAAGSVRIPYQKYADDAALYTEVSICTDGPDECPERITLREELGLLKLYQLKEKASVHSRKAEECGIELNLLPEGKRSAKQPWVDTLVNFECPFLRTTDCEDDWVSVDVGASARHSAAEVDAVRDAVQLASEKTSLLARKSREDAAMEIKICKTKAVMFGGMQTGCVREEDCAKMQNECKDNVCPDCDKGFPCHSSLANHRVNCQSPALPGHYTIDQIVDQCTNSHGLHFRVRWAGLNTKTLERWNDTWEKASTRLADAPTEITAYLERASDPAYSPPPKGWCIDSGPDEVWIEAKGPVQCEHCCKWWKSEQGRKIHQSSKNCVARPRQCGTTSLTAKAVSATRRAAEMDIFGQVTCEKSPLDWLASFVYLGNRTGADGDPMTPVKHRLAQAANAVKQGYSVFSNNKATPKLKRRLYISGVTSVLRYGSETYTLSEKAENALRQFNARNLARLTGREIADEYRAPTYDLVREIHKTRAKWLGHILRMEETSYLHQTIREIYHNNYPGSLVSTTPDHNDFNDLRSLARDRDLWRAFVRNLPTHGSSAPSGDPHNVGSTTRRVLSNE